MSSDDPDGAKMTATAAAAVDLSLDQLQDKARIDVSDNQTNVDDMWTADHWARSSALAGATFITEIVQLTVGDVRAILAAHRRLRDFQNRVGDVATSAVTQAAEAEADDSSGQQEKPPDGGIGLEAAVSLQSLETRIQHAMHMVDQHVAVGEPETATSAGLLLVSPPTSATVDDVFSGVAAALSSTKPPFRSSYFIRLNTLSPKDAVLSRIEQLIDLTKESLRDCYGNSAVTGGHSSNKQGRKAQQDLDSPPTCDDVLDLIAVNSALYRANRVISAEQGLELVVASERVHRHLAARLEAYSAGLPGVENKGKDETTPDAVDHDTPFKPALSLCVRAWADLQPELEFRSFVVDNRMCALSHYYQFLYVPEIAANAEAMQHSIMQFFNSRIKGRMGISDYVCDFAVRRDHARNDYRTVLIELNPLQENTSAAMFDWIDDADILRGRRNDECVFRYHAKPLEGAWKDHLSIRLQFVVREARAQLGWPNRADDEQHAEQAVKERFGRCLMQ